MHASGIPSPRYEWYYRPNDEPGTPSDDFTWTILQATQDNVLYFDPFTFSDSGTAGWLEDIWMNYMVGLLNYWLIE